MSSSPPPSTVGSVDLESVLNVGRRTLTSIGETGVFRQHRQSADTVYLKREDHANSLLSIESKIVIFGELQFLCGIFERFASNMTVYEESVEPHSNKTSFSATFEEDEEETSAIDSKLRQTSISSQSSSPPRAPDSPPRRKTLGSIGRLATVSSTVSDHPIQNLEGRRYGCIQIPNMTIIEILEVLIRTGLDLVDQSSDYDHNNVLHQNFVLIQTRSTSQRSGQSSYTRSVSLAGGT